jgi:hypothetical protein
MLTKKGLYCNLCPIKLEYPVRYKILFIDGLENHICENCCKTIRNSDYITSEKNGQETSNEPTKID